MTTFAQRLEELEGRVCFATMTVAAPPPPPPITVLADLNGDGKADLVTLAAPADAKGKWGLRMQLGKGDGTFAAGKVYEQPAQSPIGVAVGDLNGDGKADVAILNKDPVITTGPTPAGPKTSVFIVRTDGNGGVLPAPASAVAPKPVALPEGLETTGIAVADVNKDGAADLVGVGNLMPKPVAGNTTPPKPVVNVVTLLNTLAAKGTFQKPLMKGTDAVPGQYRIARAGDLDKNGSGDLVAFQVGEPAKPPVATTAVQQPAPPKNVLLLMTNVNGGMKTKAVGNPVMPAGRMVGVADVDGDGVAELVGATDKGIIVSKFDGVGMIFTAPKPAAAIGTPPASFGGTQILVGDLNGDGKADLVVGSDKGVTVGLSTSTAAGASFAWKTVK